MMKRRLNDLITVGRIASHRLLQANSGLPFDDGMMADYKADSVPHGFILLFPLLDIESNGFVTKNERFC